MKEIALKDIKEGMRIGESVHDNTGKLLISSGGILTKAIIKNLKREKKTLLYILEEGEKAKDNTGSVGMEFLDGMKKKYGSIMGERGAVTSKKEEKSKVSPRTRAEVRRPLPEKKPIVVVKNAKREFTQEETKELNNFLRVTEKEIKRIVAHIDKEGCIIPFSLTNNVIKMFNSIMKKKSVILILKKMMKHDIYVYEHALYVSIVSIAAGIQFGYTVEEVRTLGIAGLLIDSGMISVPPEILNKNAILKPEEKKIIQKHPAKSYGIAVKIPGITDAAKEIILNHHEKIDGSGYPKKKTGKEISKLTKLITIIDVYHSLISDRPFSKAKTHKEAFFTIFMNKGRQFDSEIIEEIIKKTGG